MADHEQKSAAELLSEMTGRPVEDFRPDDDLDYPHPDELESVDHD